MLNRRLPALVFVAVATGLLALAMMPHEQLHGLLSRAADHPVTEPYTDAVHARALAFGALALAFGAAAWVLAPTLAAPMRRTEWARPSGTAFAIIGIGATVRAALLNGPLHYDEAFTLAEYVHRSPLFFLTRYTHSNNHVFHTLAVWLVPSDALWARRLPAFLAGAALLFATYELARRWHGESVARCAAMLAAVASPLVEYSVQARGYTMMTLAFLLLFLIEDDRVRAAVIAAGAWTIPTMLYAAAGWALWDVRAHRDPGRTAFTAIAGGALTLLLYLPILIVSGVDSIVANGTTLSVPYPVLFRELPRTFRDLAANWSYSYTVPVAILLAVAAIVAIVRGRANALAFTLLASAILLVVLRKVPFARVWVFVLPLFLIAAASTLARRTMPMALAIALAVVFGINAIRVTERESYVEDPAMRETERVATLIQTLPDNARVLVSTPLDSAYAFYVPDRIVQNRFDSDPAAVRAAILSAPRAYAVLSHRGGDGKLLALRLPRRAVPVARFADTTLMELR